MPKDEKSRITYRFDFEDGSHQTFDIVLDRTTLRLPAPVSAPPEWTSLGRHRCAVCRLDPETDSYCPIAVRMAPLVDGFKEHASFEEVQVSVATERRSYSRRISLQQGVSALTGLVMATSGCPVMEYLKPMARFHLPFASVEETAFRMLSIYLIAQLKREAAGLGADWTLERLKEIYADIAEVNQSFAQRLAEVTSNDANINALVILDCFAKGVPMAAHSMVRDHDALFSAYLDAPQQP